ncbi:hypothetical protein M422DRAFT_275648 [Sphaerobolus stellatus SS14]|uniref:CCHC-type domain-containing protein n=1 Tax=Sphaerobolus stellatus (strain SS14) TaxID=990650 RepID=A0A0C9UEQ1_SPHS4|nr:hypothetical protein M422DRAFT_275648 [Sphaerobolus stellatus SS14]
MTAQLDGAVVNRTAEYSGIQQMVSVKMGSPPNYSSEHNLEKFENWGEVQLQFLGQCLTDEAQEWFYWNVGWFDQEIKHWDLESVIMGLQKWFMPTLSMNKVAVNYDTINKSSTNQNAGSSKQHNSGNKPIQKRPTTQLLSTRGGGVRINPTYGKNPIKLGNTANKPTQSNPIRTAPKANNTVVCYKYNQPGHIQPNCPFPDKDRRIAGARIEEVILEEDEDQFEEFDENVLHLEEQQDWEDQPEEDDQQYH